MERRRYGFGQGLESKPPVFNFREGRTAVETTMRFSPGGVEQRVDRIKVHDVTTERIIEERPDHIDFGHEFLFRNGTNLPIRITISQEQVLNPLTHATFTQSLDFSTFPKRPSDRKPEQTTTFAIKQEFDSQMARTHAEIAMTVHYVPEPKAHVAEFVVGRRDHGFLIDGTLFSTKNDAETYIRSTRSMKENLIDLFYMQKEGEFYELSDEVLEAYYQSEDAGDGTERKDFSGLAYLQWYVDYVRVLEGPIKGFGFDKQQAMEQLYSRVKTYLDPHLSSIYTTEDLEKLTACLGTTMLGDMINGYFFRPDYNFSEALGGRIRGILYREIFPQKESPQYNVKCVPDFDPESNNFRSFRLQIVEAGSAIERVMEEAEVALGEAYPYRGKIYRVDSDPNSENGLIFSIEDKHSSERPVVTDESVEFSFQAKDIDWRKVLDTVQTSDYTGWEKALDILAQA